VRTKAVARILVALAAISALVVGCGDDSSTDSGSHAGSGGSAAASGMSGAGTNGGTPAGGGSPDGTSGQPSGGGAAASGGRGGGAGSDAGRGGAAGEPGGEAGGGRGGETKGGEGGDAGTGNPGGAGGTGPTPGFRWVKVLNAETHGFARSGSQLVAASFFGGTPFDAGCGELVASDGTLLVASFRESDGHCQWSPQFSPGGGGKPLALQVGADARLYLGGDFSGPSLDLGGGPLPKLVANWHAPFVGVFDFDANGLTHVWSTAFAGRGEVNGLDLGTGLNVAGTFYTNVTIDGQPAVPCCTASYGLFATRLAAADDAVWVAGARAVSSTSLDEVLVQDVVESGGTVFVTGRIDGPVTFGTTQVTPTGWGDVFLAGYDAANGALKWLKHWGASSSYGIGRRLVREPGGTVVLGAVANEGTDFGDGALVGAQDHLVFARFDANGNVSDVASVNVNYGNVFDIARRPNGNLVVLGMFRRTLVLGGVTLVNEPHGDPFVAELSADFSTWSRAESFGTPTEDFNPGRLTLTSDGSIALALNFLQWASARGQRFTATTSWNTLLGVLD
jgi:hypothetical protein